MYFIIHTHLSNHLSQIVAHHQTLNEAREGLLDSAKAYLYDLYGRLLADHVQIINYPHALESNVVADYLAHHGQGELVLVVSEVDHQKIYLYKKHSITDAGWLYTSTKHAYQALGVFQITNYNSASPTKDIEYVQHGPVAVPKAMTVAPMADLMRDLVQSERFLARKSKYE